MKTNPRCAVAAAISALTAFCLVTTSAPAAEFPATPVGQSGQQWFAAFNSGDYAAMEKLHAATDPESVAKRRALQDYRIYLLTRGIDADKVDQTGNAELTVAGREKLTGSPINLVVRASAQAPHEIVEMGLRPAAANAASPQGPRASELDAITKFDAILTRASEADEFAGAALVAHNGKVIFKKAYGIADKRTNAPNQTDTKFNLASAGKMFTGVSVLQLAQSGKLSLDDKVGKHLPNYANKDVREKVTIRQLLTHTSGLGEMFNAKYKERREQLRTVKDYVALFETDPLEFEPGSRWSYSNAGFCLLGAIVEAASGEDYYAYLDKHIFQAAGMTNTGAFETDKPQQNLAIGYTRDGATTPEELRARHDNIAMHVVKGSPAGGSFSTVEDLARFADAILNRRLLNDEYTRMATTAQAKTGLGTDASGLGFQIEPVNGHAIVGHRGGFPGISASFFMYPDDGYTVIVLSNYDSVAPVLALRMRDWIVSTAPHTAAAAR